MRYANEIVPETCLDMAAEFLNKLAGCDFGKSLNVTVLQKYAPAKSHEKTWELTGWFSVVKPCNCLIFNEKQKNYGAASMPTCSGFQANV